MEMTTIDRAHKEQFKQRLVQDLYRLRDLITRVTLGEEDVRAERDQLQNAVEIKLALLWGLEREEEV